MDSSSITVCIKLETHGAHALQQKTVGTVVKTEDSVDPIALLTVLPLRRHSTLKCLQEIKTYLSSNTKSADNKQLLDKVRLQLSNILQFSGGAFLLAETPRSHATAVREACMAM